MSRMTYILCAACVPIATGAFACGTTATKAGTRAETAGSTGTIVGQPPTGEPVDDPDCPSSGFPALSADPANGAYPNPYLNVYCTETELVVESNAIPAYEFVPLTPNGLSAQSFTFVLPRYPKLAAATTDIPLLGTIGVAVNGMPLFGPNEAQFPDPYGDPVYNGIVDDCLGHTGPGGTYHYHALVVACLTAVQGPGQPSPIIGYAADGFPIYGPYGCLDSGCSQVVEMQSSYEQTGDPSTYAWDNHAYAPKSDPRYLDECNGRIGPDGSYRYHATRTFPYILGCYAGTAVAQQGGGGPPGGGPPGGGQ